jgi:hypothetical protein
MRKTDWLKLLFQNRKIIFGFFSEGLQKWKNPRKNESKRVVDKGVFE